MGKEKELIDYPTIKAAVAGEVWAIEKVVAHYADYIEEACTVEAKGPDGSVRKYVDEDMKQTVTRHCQRQFEIVRKRRRNFVVFRRQGGATKSSVSLVK